MSPTNISECSFLPIYIKRLAISALVCSLLQMVNIWTNHCHHPNRPLPLHHPSPK